MSVYYYDESLVEDLRRITGDGRITIHPVDNVFRDIARLNNDNIEFPMISIARNGWSLTGDKPQYMAFEGGLKEIILDREHKPDKVTKLQAIPIRISWTMDVWTRTRLENDNLLRELIFYYTTSPTLEVKIPYGLECKKEARHRFNIFFDLDIEDNSDIVSHKDRGEYFRQTIGIYCDDAYLWRVNTRDVIEFECDTVEIDDSRYLNRKSKEER